MALKPAKATPPDPVEQIAAPDINLEDAIADQLLDAVDWQKVMISIIKKAPARLFAWLVGGGGDRPINLSAYPELSALPGSDSEEKA